MVCNTQIAVSAVDDSESVSGLEPFASPRENERVKSSSRVWSIVRVLIDTSRVSGSRSRRHAGGSVDPVRDGDRFDDVAIVFVGARGSECSERDEMKILDVDLDVNGEHTVVPAGLALFGGDVVVNSTLGPWSSPSQ